jgi:uncharacterized protein (TIGR04141 family)
LVDKGAKPTAASLYRLTRVGELSAAVRDKYLNGTAKFTLEPCTVGDREALLVHGHMATPRAAWADRVQALTAVSFEASNQNAAAVLIITGADKTAWAISYGMGHHLLDQTRVDPGFGQRIAIRVADPDQLNSLTSKTLDRRAKVDRSSIPSGSQLRGFGLADFGELVTRVVATAELSGLSIGKSFKVRGADALNLPLAHTPDDLLADLTAIEQALKKPPPPQLQVLEQLVALKKNSPVANALDTALEKALLDPNDSTVGVAWPHEGINDNGTPASFRVKGRGPATSYEGVPSVEILRAAVNPDKVLESLTRNRIQLFSDPDGETVISSDIPLRKWVAYETTLDDRRYFLHDGQWYLMDEDYAKQLRVRVRDIFDRSWGTALPPWEYKDGKKIEEKKYNDDAAAAIGGLNLDRQLIRTTQNKHGFEASDILAPDGSMVHVKKADASAPLSHLFAQGHNSAHSLMYDNEAREKFRELVAAKGGDPDSVPNKPPAVVFAIARYEGEPFDPESLYSFSQVTLVRTVDDLAARGIDAFIVPIDNDLPI